MNFRDFYMIMEYLDAGYPAMLPSDWSGSEQPDNFASQPVFLPSIDLGLPSTTLIGKISQIVRDKNPIFVQLSDGTQLFFTLDQYKRIKGSPERGRTMTVVFQRLGNDRSRIPSMIQSCQVT